MEPPVIAPAITAETEEFWRAGADGRLTVEQCSNCGQHIFPPRGVCRRCYCRTLELCEVRPPGVIYSLTTNHNIWQPETLEIYTIGLIEFPRYSSTRFIGILEGFTAEPEIGDMVDFKLTPAFDGGFRIEFYPWSSK